MDASLIKTILYLVLETLVFNATRTILYKSNFNTYNVNMLHLYEHSVVTYNWRFVFMGKDTLIMF